MATGRLNGDRIGAAGIDLAIERNADGRIAVRSSMMSRLWEAGSWGSGVMER